MADDFLSRAPVRAPERKGSRTRILLGAMLAAFVVGSGLTAYVVTSGVLSSVSNDVAKMVEDDTARQVALAAPAPAASQPPAVQQVGLEARVAGMEQRINELNLQSQAVSGNAARAEGLLIAFAARRAIQSGSPLDYLGDQLQLRFGAAQPNAVRNVLAAAKSPVTVEQLLARLDNLAPRLAAEDEGGWTWFTRELGELFVVRKQSTPSPVPEERLTRARLRLQSGMIDGAIGEVQGLPGASSPEGRAWIQDAQRYSGAMKALDLIEKAAILEPTQLRDSSGRKVEQPSPVLR